MQSTLLTTATCEQSYISKISTPKAKKKQQNNAGNSMFGENVELCCLTFDFMLTATPPSVSSSSSNNFVPQ